MKMIYSFIVASLIMFSSCTISTKPFTANQLGGYSNPNVIVERTWRGGRVVIGSDANGTVDIDAELNADGTFKIKGKAEFASNVSGVVDAEGRRMPGELMAGMQTRQMEMIEKLDAGLTERHRIVGENLKAVGQMVALAAAGGGSAIAKVIEATAPILAGSAASLDLGKFGSLDLNLGTAPNSHVPPAEVIPEPIVTPGS